MLIIITSILADAALLFFFFCSSDAGDLLGLVAELKHTQCRLRGQNSSLLRSISQCEETNLQLMMDVSELRSKLARCCVMSRCLPHPYKHNRHLSVCCVLCVLCFTSSVPSCVQRKLVLWLRSWTKPDER